ncbi:conserved hypothetical protein [Trichinella spiralis]|uniref:hypothetical protein n=1 Tax=Trichinella spiralis TaxID=6334 RepID=UPI0001EFD7D7|nr:conserved hypothetical protein [Trichinella spiralis]
MVSVESSALNCCSRILSADPLISGNACASDQRTPARFHPVAVSAGKTRRTSLARCAPRMLQTGSTSGHRNRPSPGRPWPSLCPAPPHQYDTGQGLLVSPGLYRRLRCTSPYVRTRSPRSTTWLVLRAA